MKAREIPYCAHDLLERVVVADHAVDVVAEMEMRVEDVRARGQQRSEAPRRRRRRARAHGRERRPPPKANDIDSARGGVESIRVGRMSDVLIFARHGALRRAPPRGPDHGRRPDPVRRARRRPASRRSGERDPDHREGRRVCPPHVRGVRPGRASADGAPPRASCSTRSSCVPRSSSGSSGRSCPTPSRCSPPTGFAPRASSSFRTGPRSPSGGESSRLPSSPGSGGLRRRPRQGWPWCATCWARPSRDGDGVLEVDGQPLTSEGIQAAISAAFLKNGASADVFVVSHGPQTAIGHHLGEGQIRAGESIVVDLWPRDTESACFADMTRTFVVGEPPAEVAEWHRLSREWLDVAFAAIRPGVTARSVYDAVCDAVEAAGFRRSARRPRACRSRRASSTRSATASGSRCTRSRSSACSATPRSSPATCSPSSPAFTARTPSGLRIEDLVLVTEDGYENLTQLPVRPRALAPRRPRESSSRSATRRRTARSRRGGACPSRSGPGPRAGRPRR